MNKNSSPQGSASTTDARDNLVAEIYDCVRGLFNVVSEQYREVERETGLSYSQFWTLKVISGSSPVRVSDLARKMHLHPATMVGILDRLETRQLITRTRSCEDRRVVDVNLTIEARRIVVSMPEVFHSRMLDGFKEVADGDLMAMLGSLKQLSALLESNCSMRDIASRCAAKNSSQKIAVRQDA